MKTIAIYGAGDYGTRMLSFLRMIGGRVTFFIQSAEADRDEYEGVPIISATEFFKSGKECLIFIAIRDAEAVDQVYELLRQNNYPGNKIFDCRMFIEENLAGNTYVEDGNSVCILCGRRMKEFLSAGVKSSLFSELKVIGGGYRNNARCPYCGSLDRNRWVYWVLKEKTDIFVAERTVLHFAPEKMIQKKLLRNDKCDYYSGDIILKQGSHKIDVTNIHFKDNTMDYIIINHVLEHIPDEKRAVEEMKRVLKKNGKIVMSFPVSMVQKTFEDETIDSPEDKEKYYGQSDHVRLYGNDYKERFEKYGLKVRAYSPKDSLNDAEIERYGLIKDDIVLICCFN